MTRSSVIAKQMYTIAVDLKRYTSSALIMKKNRDSLSNKLSVMMFLRECVGMRTSSADTVSEVLDKLASVSIDVGDIKSELDVAETMSDCSEEYCAVISKMRSVLSMCIDELNDRKIGYRKRIRKCIFAFHNLPRALFSLSDPLKLSPQEAIEYSNSYL